MYICIYLFPVLTAVACYDAPPGLPSPTSVPSFSPPARRVLARVGADGSIDTSTTMAWTPFSTGAVYGIFSAASVDGSAMWVTGNDGSQRLWYIPFGASTTASFVAYPSVYVGSTVRVYAGQLYTLCAYHGICAVGTGMPTGLSGGGSTVRAVPGLGGINPFSPYPSNFAFASPTTAWVSDTNGVLTRVVYNTTTLTWSPSPSTGWNLPAYPSLLDVAVLSGGSVYTLSAASSGRIYGFVYNTSGAFFTPLASAPTNTSYVSIVAAPCSALLEANLSLSSCPADIALGATPLASSAPVPFRRSSVLILRTGTGTSPLVSYGSAAPLSECSNCSLSHLVMPE